MIKRVFYWIFGVGLVLTLTVLTILDHKWAANLMLFLSILYLIMGSLMFLLGLGFAAMAPKMKETDGAPLGKVGARISGHPTIKWRWAFYFDAAFDSAITLTLAANGNIWTALCYGGASVLAPVGIRIMLEAVRQFSAKYPGTITEEWTPPKVANIQI